MTKRLGFIVIWELLLGLHTLLLMFKVMLLKSWYGILPGFFKGDPRQIQDGSYIFYWIEVDAESPHDSAFSGQ